MAEEASKSFQRKYYRAESEAYSSNRKRVWGTIQPKNCKQCEQVALGTLKLDNITSLGINIRRRLAYAIIMVSSQNPSSGKYRIYNTLRIRALLNTASGH